MKSIKPFYIWWITNLIVASGVFWAWHSGIIAKIWHDDVTMITSGLAVLYLVTTIMIGYIAYTKDFTNKIVDACWFLSEQMLALGMLGTVIGFIYLLTSGITSASVTDPTSLAALLANMSVGLGIALYTNATGILSSLITKALLYAVTYDHEE
jgi:flagellar motor component MotA